MSVKHNSFNTVTLNERVHTNKLTYEEPEFLKEIDARVLSRISIVYRECLEAYYVDKLNQSQIALFFNCTQANISVTIKDAIKAYKIYENLVELEDEAPNFLSECERALYKRFKPSESLRQSRIDSREAYRLKAVTDYLVVLRHFAKTTSQSESAYKLKRNQSFIRDVVLRTIKALTANNSTASAKLLTAYFNARVPGTSYQKKKDPFRINRYAQKPPSSRKRANKRS